MFERYAVFFTPTGSLADFGAAWLGWDSAAGCTVTHPQVGDIDVARITATPRKYGFHATLKAPFRLSGAVDTDQLQTAVAAFANHHAKFEIGALSLDYANGFIALRPTHDAPALRAFAAAVVKELDGFRAPLNDDEIARRRKSRLTERQDQQMLTWGYPYVFDDFNFHMTLSGRLPQTSANSAITALTPLLSAMLQKSCIIDGVTLMGQDKAGMFHQIHRYSLTG